MSLQEELEDELSISTGHSFSNLKITASRALQPQIKWSVLIASTTKSCIAKLQILWFLAAARGRRDEIVCDCTALGSARGRAGRSVRRSVCPTDGRTGRSKQLNLVGANWNQNQFSFVTTTGKTKGSTILSLGYLPHLYKH